MSNTNNVAAALARLPFLSAVGAEYGADSRPEQIPGFGRALFVTSRWLEAAGDGTPTQWAALEAAHRVYAAHAETGYMPVPAAKRFAVLLWLAAGKPEEQI